MSPRDSWRVKRLLLAQVATAGVLALLGFLISKELGLSALLGAGIGTLGNALFAIWILGRYRAQEPGLLVMRFYGAEVAKIGLVLALFVGVFVWVKPLSMPALLGAYLVVQLASTLGAGR